MSLGRCSSLRPALAVLLLAACGGESVRPLPDGVAAPRFERVPVDFEHVWNRASSRPLVGAAAIDVDGDGREEIFVGGGDGQADALLRWRGGRLVDVVRATGLAADTATYGATSFDLDADGDTDLVVARDDGVAIYTNEGGARFRGQALPLTLPPHSVPVAVAVADVNRDGQADLYVAVAVDAFAWRAAAFEDEGGRPGVLLLGDGALGFRDVTTPETATRHAANAARFVDLDGDGRQELAIAHDAGPVEILRNAGGELVPAWEGPFGTWMGVAAGDVDADGDPDLLFTNVGPTISERKARGRLRGDRAFTRSWLLLRNDGGLSFTDVADEAGLARLGFARDVHFADLDLDGRLDLLAAQNRVRDWSRPTLPGKALLDVGTTQPDFRASEALPNPAWGRAPLLVDFDGDGRRDVVWINCDGRPRAYRSLSTADRLRVRLPDDVHSLGARVRLDGAPHFAVREVHAGGGAVDPGPELVFAVPRTGRALRVHVAWPGGGESVVEDPPLDRVIEISPP